MGDIASNDVLKNKRYRFKTEVQKGQEYLWQEHFHEESGMEAAYIIPATHPVPLDGTAGDEGMRCRVHLP